MLQFGHSANHRDICENLSENFIVDYISFDLGFKAYENNKTRLHYVKMKKNSKTLSFIRFFLTAIKLSTRLKPKYIVVVISTQTINSIFFFLLTPFLYHKSFKYLDIRTASVNQSLYKRKLENYLVKLLSKLYHTVMVFNNEIRKIIGVNIKKTVCIPLGGSAISGEMRNIDGLQLIYIGAYINRDIDILVKAYASFIKEFSPNNSKLTLIGYGDKELFKLKQLVNSLGLSKYVYVFDRMTHNELKSYVEKANVGISFVPINAYYNHQTPTKILEYGLSGLFTIATNTAASQKIINDINGVLCEDNVDSLKNAIFNVSKNNLYFNHEEIKKTFHSYDIKNIVNDKMINKIFIK